MGTFRGRPEPNKKDDTHINRDITADPVRLVDENGEQVGIVPLKEALSRALEADLDLVEVSPQAKPPVCKILDYGKYKFQQKKKLAEARKKQVIVTIKEITIRPRTEDHDYQIKLKKARQFLEKGDKVKFNLRFRGREIAHQENGLVVMQRLENDLGESIKVDQRPRMEGRQMVMIVSPTGKPAKKAEKPASSDADSPAAE